jgi:hypothetical protein
MRRRRLAVVRPGEGAVEDGLCDHHARNVAAVHNAQPERGVPAAPTLRRSMAE